MADRCGIEIALNHATLDQLNEVSTYLSGIKGRKNLIWIGNGIPSMTIPPSCQDFTLPLRKTYDLLEDAQVTVYPLDPNGVKTPPVYTPTGPPATWGPATAAFNGAWLKGLATNHLSMEAVAEATGGVAYYERNDLDSLMAKAVDAGANYYTLSYAPPSVAYDGKYHAINIKVDRPDVHLLYRKGYSSEDPVQIAHETDPTFAGKAAKMQPDALALALSPIAPPATQLLFDVRVEPNTEPANPFDPPVMGALNPKLRTTPLTRYSLLYALPQSQIAFADAGGGTYTGSVEFDAVAFDTDGKLVTSLSQTQKLPLTNEEYGEFIATPFQFFQQIDLPPGQFTLRIGVLDGVSNKVGTVEIPLTVGKIPASPAVTAPK
jgi:hypothetical protein